MDVKVVFLKVSLTCYLQISVLMPVLWLTAFGFSYPQTYWKELDTVPAWQYVLNNWNVQLAEWVGLYQIFSVFLKSFIFISSVKGLIGGKEFQLFAMILTLFFFPDDL